MTRCVVIVSPYFPPSQLAGVHRARHLAKYLPAAGWTPIVLCVDEAFQEQRLDPALAGLVPHSTEVVKVRALPASTTRLIGLGDISLRAWTALRASLVSILGSRRVDVVLITAAPNYSLLLAPMIKKRFGIPVVLDFQDPWVSRWGAKQALWSKAGLSHRLATWLEPMALQAADFVTSVSEVQNAEMAARYSWLSRERMAAVPIGGDKDDFAALVANQAGGKGVNGGLIELSYVGSYWPAAEPALRALLRGAAKLRAEAPDIAKRLRINFLGTDASMTGALHRVRPLAEAEGVADMVLETPQRLRYLDALAAMANADALLLIGSNEPHYTPSKIYPALMSGRPFLSLFHVASRANDVLKSVGGGVALSFADAAHLARLEAPIAEALCTLAMAPESVGHVDPAAYAAFEAPAIAARFASIFESVAAQGAGVRTGREIFSPSVRLGPREHDA